MKSISVNADGYPPGNHGCAVEKPARLRKHSSTVSSRIREKRICASKAVLFRLKNGFCRFVDQISDGLVSDAGMH